MPSPLWRDRLYEALHRQRLPKAYVDRLVEELSDHALDLEMENSSMDAEQTAMDRLGTPTQLATAARAAYQQRTFAGRHPALTFLAGPLVLLPASFFALLLVLVSGYWATDLVLQGSMTANDEINAPPSDFEKGLVQVYSLAVRFVPSVVSVWILARLGRRSGRHGWGISACVLVALAVCFFSSVVQESPHGTATWQLTLNWSIGIAQLIQAIVPLTLGVWLLRRVTTDDADGFVTSSH